MRRHLLLHLIACCFLWACGETPASEMTAPNDNLVARSEMLRLLDQIEMRSARHNFYLGDGMMRAEKAALERMRHLPVANRLVHQIPLAEYLLRLGKEREAIELLSEAHEAIRDDFKLPQATRTDVAFRLGVAWMRLGETQNCCARNNADSCLMPISGEGVHSRLEGSSNAMGLFRHVMETSDPRSTPALKARWLYNVAAMTLGEWPERVPAEFLLRPDQIESHQEFPRFHNVAGELKLGTFDNCGGVVVDDFDGDEWLDILVSTWDPARSLRHFRNRGDGTFEDVTDSTRLGEIRGGLNLVQADYDNDGDIDVLVLRGAWWSTEGRHPNSLLQNDGAGNFVDVTFEAGLGGKHYPTQAAAFGDYDNDGDLDLYIGNESSSDLGVPSQLFRNDGTGKFTEVTQEAGVANHGFAKGVSFGDFDEDGYPDLYVSNLRGKNRLYHNQGDGTFRDVATERGVAGPHGSFPSWFWDLDNDGHLDLFVGGYDASLEDLAAYHFGARSDKGRSASYLGDGKGGFVDRAVEHGLSMPLPIMGCNFGDLDNDGWLDFYLGTGDTNYETIVPNVMYRNLAGRRFADVTTAGGFGNLQKGHGVAFADLDNDGDQDVFQQMGGAFTGDRFYNALFENPGFEKRQWVALRLEGVRANRCGLGARIVVTVDSPEGSREIHRTVGPGSSFGGNPLRQEIGLGPASRIERLEVRWPVSNLVQVFEGVEPGRLYHLREGDAALETVPLRPTRLGGQAD